MQETERAKPADDFRQGDIIRFEDGRAQVPPSDLGVIINADCDLVHGRLDGVIAYLPIYPFQTYLTRFWAPSFLEALRRTHLHRVRDICGLNEDEANDLLRWLDDTSIQDACDRLSTTFGLSRKNISQLTEHLETLVYIVDSDRDPYSVFIWYCHRTKDPEKFARAQIKQAYENMGNGHFFVSEIVGDAEIGFVVRMRRIYTIDVTCCFPSQSSRLSSTGGSKLTAVRIARLSSPFRFKLAQLFACQFSRIGLPDDITSLSSLAIESALQQLLENSL